MSSSRFAHHARQTLEAEGYRVHSGTTADGPELVGRFWFTWSVHGMADCEVGPACSGLWDAWASALDHRLSNSRIEVHRVGVASSPLEPFHPAVVPKEVLDVRSFAARYGLSEEAASAQISRLRAQAIYMNDRYQVNVEVVDAPFGVETGDVFWLSIKRRDKAPVHDWRELQQIKNMIVGDEHEAFEVYPAESRLVDTANQYHLWVFKEAAVRLPVGYRSREVMSNNEAAAVGAGQRGFAGLPKQS
jgi:hypothetical protein